MCSSRIVYCDNGEWYSRDIPAATRANVLKAVRREKKKGKRVVSAYVGGCCAIALARRVYP